MDVNERRISKKDVKNTSKQIDFFSKNSNNEATMTSKRKYIKSGEYTKEAILKRKMDRIFGKFEKLHEQEGKNWYKKLANIHKPIEELKRDIIPNLSTGKRSYVKSGYYTKEAISQRKITKLANKFKKITNEAESNLKMEKSWYEELKEKILNQFFNQNPKFELNKEALGVTKRYVLDLKKCGLSLFDPLSLLKEVKPLVLEKFKEFPKTKQQLTLECEMKKTNPATGETITDQPHFHSYQHLILEGNDFDEIFEKMKDKIILSFEKWISRGSQWNFQSGLKLFLNISNVRLLKGSSWIPLPKKLKNKNAIINPENKDKKCFLWCIAIHELLKEDPSLRNPQRITKNLIKKAKEFNLNGVEFPCKLSDINKFENNNKSIAINLIGYDEEEEIFPLRVSAKECKNRVNILLIENNGVRHYCLVKRKNMSRLLSSQNSKRKSKKHYCEYCFQKFGKEKLLKEHLEYRSKFKCGKTVFPKKGQTTKFINFQNMHNIPFVIYADYECYLEPIEKNIGENTHQFQKHKPSGFCYLIKCFDDKLYPPKLKRYTKRYEDEDVSLKFMKSLQKDVKKIYKQFPFQKKIEMKNEDIKDFENAKTCYACNKKFEKNDKVKDHCHYTGKYRGASCSACNTKMKIPKFIPVIIHNLQNYDSHLFIKELGVPEGEINCIPKTEEKYISFTKDIIVDKFKSKQTQKIVFVKRQLIFIDSFKFMGFGLEKLTKNLTSDEKLMLKRFFPCEEERSLLEGKGFFPYDWFTSLEKLEEESFPAKKKFYNKLNNENISQEDYEHAYNVWKKFNMNNMRQYHDLYLKTDVIHLADFFENFRKICKKNYGLDPAWYFTSPGLAWDAMLKLTGVELELITDPNMYLMIEKGVRGGISTIIKRYAEANNPYMNEKYNPEEENIYIPYLDANNLYGWAMSEPSSSCKRF